MKAHSHLPVTNKQGSSRHSLHIFGGCPLHICNCTHTCRNIRAVALYMYIGRGISLSYTRIDRNTHSCSLRVHWQGNIIVQLIWRLPLHMLVFVHNMYSTHVYILYKKNKQAYGLEACCLSEPAEANRRRGLAGWLHTCSSHAKHICIFVFLYLCISVFEYLCICIPRPSTKDIWRPPALHILSFSSLYCFYWRLACALAPASRITETYNIAVC